MNIENINKIVKALPAKFDATIHLEFRRKKVVYNGSFLCPEKGYRRFIFGNNLDIIIKHLSAL